MKEGRDGGLVLEDLGSFFAGGRPVETDGKPVRRITYSAGFANIEHDPNGHYWIEQAYVQYFIPKRRRFRLPLLLIHGGGLTGSCWEHTPDGRPGWLRRFLEWGIASFVIDMPERGRSGFCAHGGYWEGEPIVRSDEEAWRLYRLGRPEDFRTRTPFPGQLFPVGALHRLAQMTVPRWPANAPMMLEGLKAAIEKIGPCIVLGHSQGGGMAMRAAVALPDLVRGCVVIEPHGLPEAGEMRGINGRPCLLVAGDFLDQCPEWVDLDARARVALSAWGEAGGKGEVLDLPKRGIAGNSHMLMHDANSDQVAALIVEWLDSHFH